MRARWRTSPSSSDLLVGYDTIDSDEGIKRQPPRFRRTLIFLKTEQNVFNVKVNFLDALLVEGEPADILDLKDKTRLLIATGDGILSHTVGRETFGKSREVEMITGANGTNAAFPDGCGFRPTSNRAHGIQAFVAAAEDENRRKNYTKVLDNWKEKVDNNRAVSGDYKAPRRRCS